MGRGKASGRGRSYKAQKAIEKKLKQHARSGQAAQREFDAIGEKEDFSRSTDLLLRYNKANTEKNNQLDAEKSDLSVNCFLEHNISKEQILKWLRASQKLEFKEFLTTIFYAIPLGANDQVSSAFLARNKFINTFADIDDEQLVVNLNVLSIVPACLLYQLLQIKQQNGEVETQEYNDAHKLFIRLIEHNVILCCVNFAAAYYILNTTGAFAEYINILSKNADFNNRVFALRFIENCLFVAKNELVDDDTIFHSCLNSILETDFSLFSTIFANLIESQDLPEALEYIITSNRFHSIFTNTDSIIQSPPLPNIVFSDACVIAHILSDKIMRIMANHKAELISSNIKIIFSRHQNIVPLLIYSLLNQYLTSFLQKSAAQSTEDYNGIIINDALKALDFIITSDFIKNEELEYTLQKIDQLINPNRSNVIIINNFQDLIYKIWPKLNIEQQQNFVQTQSHFNGILKLLAKDYETDLLKIFVTLDKVELITEWCANAGDKLTNKVTQFIVEGKLDLVKLIIEHNEYELTKKQIALLLTNQKSDSPIPEENCELLAYAFNASNEAVDTRPKLLQALMKSLNALPVLDKILEGSEELILNTKLINIALENENFKLIQWLLDNKENVTIADSPSSLGKSNDQFLQEQGSLLSQTIGNELNDIIYELAHTQDKEDMLMEQVPDILGDMAV